MPNFDSGVASYIKGYAIVEVDFLPISKAIRTLAVCSANFSAGTTEFAN